MENSHLVVDENIIYKKVEELEKLLEKMEKVCVAFSAGVDSTFLLAAAKEVLGDNVMAITAVLHSYPKRELKQAVHFLEENQIRYALVEVNELNIPEFTKNPIDRCYYCKKKIFKNILKVAEDNDIKYILDGSNISDTKQYRPGVKALEELEIISPLKEVGLTKDEIRFLSKKMGLKTWDKPAYSCLATRLEHNNDITLDKLNMVEKSENVLFDLGFKTVRVRVHNELARIELGKDEIEKLIDLDVRERVYTSLKDIGFKYVTIDMLGYKTGSMSISE